MHQIDHSDPIAEHVQLMDDVIALAGEPACWDEVSAGDQRRRAVCDPLAAQIAPDDMREFVDEYLSLGAAP